MEADLSVQGIPKHCFRQFLLRAPEPSCSSADLFVCPSVLLIKSKIVVLLSQDKKWYDITVINNFPYRIQKIKLKDKVRLQCREKLHVFMRYIHHFTYLLDYICRSV